MSTLSYFPSQEADRMVWLAIYRAKIADHSPTLGLAAKDITDTQADIDDLDRLNQGVKPVVSHYDQVMTLYQNEIASGENSPPLPNLILPTPQPVARPADVLIRSFAQVTRFKTPVACPDIVADDLGIVASGTPVDYPYPDFSLTVEAGSSHPAVRMGTADSPWLRASCVPPCLRPGPHGIKCVSKNAKP